MTHKQTVDELAKAIYTVNRHAKAAPQPKQLYDLKKAAIDKLIDQNRVKIIGLQYSKNPKNSFQHSTLLVQISDYYFHTIPTKKTVSDVPHLGDVVYQHRNPKTYMSLSSARKILYTFLNWQRPKQTKKHSSYYIPSSLGKWNGHNKNPQKKKYRS